MNSQVWWFVARSSGIIAWGLLTLSVCWGLLLSTRLLSRRVSPAWLLDFHRHLGGLAVVFTGIHLVGLAADSYVTFGWAELFVPMASSWKPGAVAFGVVAMYLLLAVELSSLAMRKLPRSLWRWIHRSSFVLFGFATYHGIVAGTDAGNRWFRTAAWSSIAIVVGLTAWLLLVARRSRTRWSSLPPASSTVQPEFDPAPPLVEPAPSHVSAPVSAAAAFAAMEPIGTIEPIIPTAEPGTPIPTPASPPPGAQPAPPREPRPVTAASWVPPSPAIIAPVPVAAPPPPSPQPPPPPPSSPQPPPPPPSSPQPPPPPPSSPQQPSTPSPQPPPPPSPAAVPSSGERDDGLVSVGSAGADDVELPTAGT